MDKTVVFVLVLLKGSEVVDEGSVGSFQKCDWYIQQINRAGNNSPYSAYCKPILIDKEIDE